MQRHITLKFLVKIGIILSILSLVTAWLIFTPSGLFAKLDAIGYAVCHRIALRSFFIGNIQFPICIRCTGMYLGAMTGLVYLAIVNPRRGGMPKPLVWIFLGLCVVGWIIDGSNSFLSLFPESLELYAPNHFLRLVSGIGMGSFLSVILFFSFNQATWVDWDTKPVLKDWREFLGFIVVQSVITVLVWIQNPFILSIFSIISVLGILTVLTMVYTIIVLVFIHRSNQFKTLRQLIFLLLIGFGLAISQIFFIDWLRFILTGTWDGFHIG